MDKVVLNNLEAEQAVLGAIIESKSARDEIISSLDVDDFVDKRNKIIFQAIYNLITGGIEVDMPSLINQISVSMKKLDQVGADYLVELQEHYYGDTNAFYHV